jgi:hypothetical protein
MSPPGKTSKVKNGNGTIQVLTTIGCTVAIVISVLTGLTWVHGECKDMLKSHMNNGHDGLDHRLDRIEAKVDQILLKG